MSTDTGAQSIDDLSVDGDTWTAGVQIDGTWQVLSRAW